MSQAVPGNWLDVKRREQVPQILARLGVLVLFIILWGFFRLARAPMPVPFLIVLIAESVFFLLYWRLISLLPSARGLQIAQNTMLASEIVFHTTIVYYLGGITWLGPFAYVIALVFASSFLDAKRGLIYTLGVICALSSLTLLDASNTIPHYTYLVPGADYARYHFLFTTLVGSAGVFVSIFAWMHWVGRQVKSERDGAIRAQQQLFAAQAQLQKTNQALELRVSERTAELQTANTALRASESLARATIESTADGILVVDREGKVAYANARFASLWRIPPAIVEQRDDDVLLGFVLDQLVDSEAFLAKVRELYQTDREDLDTLLFKDGRVFERYSRPLVTDSDVEGRVWSFRDITARRRAEESLRNQASRDPLTNCLNHAAIGAKLKELTQSGARVAVVMADIDGMKAINDTYGHPVGDAALTAVARVLSRGGALVGRYGGDEFVAVLPEAPRSEAEHYCQNVLDALRNATVTDAASGSMIPVAASLGLAVFPDEAATVDDAIRLADDAMYAEKRERQMSDESAPGRGVIADERAARMIGEIVPLLTAPGNLDDKLRHVAHRLAAAAAYDVVRFRIDGRVNGPGANPLYSRLPVEALDAWERKQAADPSKLVEEIVRGKQRPLIVRNVAEHEGITEAERQLLREAGLQSAAVVPMIWQDAVIGTLSVASKLQGAIDARDIKFLATVADQVTAIIRMETLVTDLQAATGRLQDARTDTMVLLAAAAEAHEQATGAHLHRVQALSEVLARELGYDEPSADAVGHAAILHDIGKIRVPERILLSPARLDGSEWAIMKQHTTWGAEFLAQRPGFEMAAVVAACHHERWDGAGYPRGLHGAQIPEIAQIVTVADSFDAITSDRPYRPGRSAAWAIEEIVRCAGEQFSPRVVEALQRVYARGELAGGRAEDHAAAA